MTFRTLLAVALLWAPAVAVRDGLDMTYTNLEVTDTFRGKQLSEDCDGSWKAALEYSLAPDPSGRRASMLLSKKQMFSYTNEDIHCVHDPWANTELELSDSLVNTSTEIAALVGMSSSFGPAFAASVSAGMDVAYSTKSKKFRSDLFKIRSEFRVTTRVLKPATKLRSDVYDYLISKSPSDIIEKFGAFYASKVEIGSLAKATATTTASDKYDVKSFKQRAKAAFGMAKTVSGDTSSNQSFGGKTSDSDMSIKVSTVGGVSQTWLPKGSHGEVPQFLKAWGESVTHENMRPITFDLKPLWFLLKEIGCEDCQERANNLTVELENKWAKDMAKLEEQDQLNQKETGQIGDVVAFIPWNRQDKRMFVAESSQSEKKKWYKVGESKRGPAEAFKITKGLSDPSGISFMSMASPSEKQYIVACNGWWLWWRKYVCHKSVWSEEDRKRATWKMSDGFRKDSKKFESLFYRGHYMDLENPGGGGIEWVRLSKIGGDTFKTGASWKLAELANWSTDRPAGPGSA